MNTEKIKELKEKIRRCTVVDWRFNNENNVLAALVMVDALAELDKPDCQKNKAGDAVRECRNIECHIEQFFSKEDLEKWGANKVYDHERELRFRVMRIFANVNNQLSDQQKEIERLTTKQKQIANIIYGKEDLSVMICDIRDIIEKELKND